MNVTHPRLQRERRTIYAMQVIYCRDHHGLPAGALCEACQELFDYAMIRLSRCPYQERKPTCANCPIHCYQRGMRERVREMMRYAGPKMLLKHPVLALAHLLDGRRKAPPLPQRRIKDQTKA
uniref:Nitrous oxide-stimulated promoter family protein n=1 Tax=Anaerolinea thermolimosa TaxID=229919 RepID=A0A7C4KI10_9CHLR